MGRSLRLRTAHKRLRSQTATKAIWDYVPTTRQMEFHLNPARYRLYGGAMGGGKSVALCAEAVRLSIQCDGNRGYLARHEIVTLKRTTLVTFENICPARLLKGHYRDDRILLFRNGSEIVYGGLGNEADLEKIKSSEYGWFGIDEATETSEEYFNLLCSRLRWKLPDGTAPDYRGFLASNPEPGWVKDRFVDKRLEDHAFIPALPRDNPHLPRDYDQKLRKNWPEEWTKRYLDGSWDVFGGQIYKEFDRSIHVYDDVEMNPYWDRFRVIDHGYTNPTCCLWIAIDYDGRMWIYREHYERELTIQEHAEIINNMEPDFRGTTICDPSMATRSMQRGRRAWSPIEEYREYGIFCIQAYSQDGHISEGMGINLVKQRLKNKSLFVSRECKNTIHELINYRWRDLKSGERDKNTPEVPIDRDNHAVDCIRYANMWRPLNSAPPKPPEDTNSISYWIKKHKRSLHQPFFAGWDGVSDAGGI